MINSIFELAADQLVFTPRALVVHHVPAALVGAIEPVFVDLIINLLAVCLDDVCDVVVVIAVLVVVGKCALSHLGVKKR